GVAIPGANTFEFTATLTGTYRLKYANGTCTDTSAALVIGPGAGVTATINPAGPVVLCSTLTVDFNANTGTGFTYQWLLNNSPINGQTNAQLTGIGAAGSYSVIVTNATDCRDTSAAVAVSIGAGTGDPAVFPVNSWNLYAYTGTDINFGTGNVYRGFYSINALNVNTSDQWGGNLSPSSASGYLGCAVPNDNFSWVLKRKGFPAGPYVMNIPSNDDNINVLVNGTSVYSASCCGASPTLTLGNLDANSTIEVRMVEFGGGANVAFNLTLSPLQAGSIAADQTICGGGTPSLLTSSVNASGGATNTITYQWQDSTAGGAWQNIANATNSSFQPGTLNANRWFRRKALNGPDVATSNEIQITIVFPEGNPAQFGNNGWNLYAYQGTDLNLGSGNSYLGFYTVNSLSINTADQWNGSASPSSFSGYSGCPVPLDNFTFVLKRQGFTPGAYLLNILAHDDNIRVYVNDVQIFEHLGCCDQHLGIDLGTLGANSTVEVRTAEFGGGAVANLEFVASSFQGGAIASDQTICAGIAPSLLTNVQEASGGSGSPVYQWQDSLVGGTWQNIDLATATSFQPGILTVTKWFRRRAQDGNLFVFSNEVKITVLEAPSASVSPVGPVNLCSGDLVTLTGTFSSGSSRQWLRNGAVISGQTGTTLTATLAGTYKAVATAGTCTDTSNAVVINLNPKPAPVISPTGTVTICQGQQATFNLTNFVAGQTVRWKDENATILGTGNGVSVSVTSGVYVVVSNASGCRDSSAMAFVQVVNPTLAPTGPIDLCAGNSTNLTLSGSGTASIKWFRNNQEIPGQTGPILSVNSGGTYLAEVSVIPGCSLTSNAVVVNSIAAPAATISSNSTSFCQGGTITLTANSGTGFTYVWRRNGQPISGATEVIFEANQAGDYTVVVTNSTNCSATSNVLTLNQIPNQTWFFDNDGDGYGAGQSSVNCIRPVNGFLPAELIATSGDCNDNNPSINPGRQFFSLSTNPGFTTALCSPLTGTPYTNFQFQVVYTDLNNGSLPATFPRVILDYEGNGSFTNGNDRTILMSEFDNRDNTTIDGKIYVASINSLIPGTNYTTRVLSTIGGCATQIGPFNYPDVLVVPDLQIFANDISFSQSNPPVSSPLTVSATIHNVSDFSANNFVVHLVNQYDTNIVYPDIVVPTLAAHSSTTVTWDITTPDVPAWCPMQVFVDYTNAIEESNELDNSAIRPFVNGNFNLPGSISPNLSVSPATVITGGSVTVSGTATYTNTAVPLADPSVAGAQVTITINQTGATFTTFTNSSGGFSF
ncbi:MAG TPA: CARDB domain-containing protein, partial [Catalimonadaceae bacterium]|nr:CARDB domain-containing protein [Catalimonadaceae bacterium]